MSNAGAVAVSTWKLDKVCILYPDFMRSNLGLCEIAAWDEVEISPSAREPGTKHNSHDTVRVFGGELIRCQCHCQIVPISGELETLTFESGKQSACILIVALKIL